MKIYQLRYVIDAATGIKGKIWGRWIHWKQAKLLKFFNTQKHMPSTHKQWSWKPWFLYSIHAKCENSKVGWQKRKKKTMYVTVTQQNISHHSSRISIAKHQQIVKKTRLKTRRWYTFFQEDTSLFISIFFLCNFSSILYLQNMQNLNSQTTNKKRVSTCIKN